MGIFDKVKRAAESFQSTRTQNPIYNYGKFVVLDVETTGLNPDEHRIVEISLVSVENGEVIEAWTSLINPEGPVGKTEIHGITNNDVRNAPLFREKLVDVTNRISNVAVVAHNAKFDLSFLKSEYLRSEKDLPVFSSICTLRASNYYQPHLSRRRLIDCCEDIGIEISNAHSATGDAIATAQLFHFYMDSEKNPLPRAEDLNKLRDPSSHPEHISDSNKRNDYVSQQIARSQIQKKQQFSNSTYRELLNLLSSVTFSEILSNQSFDGEFEYLEKLVEILEDGTISREESLQLESIAKIYELTDSQIELAHKSMIKALALQALKDESISVQEREELTSVAETLGISKSTLTDIIRDAKEHRARNLSSTLKTLPDGWKLGNPLRVGDKVVFTGCDPAQRAILENNSKKMGVAILSKVTAKTNVLVTDGSYVGNKANDAKKFGTRVVSPDEYEILLDYIQPQLVETPETKKMKVSSQTGAEGLDPAVVREWAIRSGIEVTPKGRIHSRVYDEYKKQHNLD